MLIAYRFVVEAGVPLGQSREASPERVSVPGKTGMGCLNANAVQARFGPFFLKRFSNGNH
jgi:hypothetical protein